MAFSFILGPVPLLPRLYVSENFYPVLAGCCACSTTLFLLLVWIGMAIEYYDVVSNARVTIFTIVPYDWPTSPPTGKTETITDAANMNIKH